MAMTLLTAIQLEENGTDIIVNHTFLEAGHSHLEADTTHAAIGKTKKRATTLSGTAMGLGTFNLHGPKGATHCCH
jgi:hypothetical protein